MLILLTFSIARTYFSVFIMLRIIFLYIFEKGIFTHRVSITIIYLFNFVSSITKTLHVIFLYFAHSFFVVVNNKSVLCESVSNFIKFVLFIHSETFLKNSEQINDTTIKHLISVEERVIIKMHLD